MFTLGSLNNPRRRRQGERHQIKGVMSTTIAVHVRYKSFYVSLRSLAKQECELTICVVWGTRTTKANFSYFYLGLNAVITYLD